MPPDIVASYLEDLAAQLELVLRGDLVGVYVGGSYALGAYDHGRSDLDVAAVVRLPLPRELADAVVAAVRHEQLPCPARGLELVVYTPAVTREPTIDAGFELNLNTGPEMPFRADFAPRADELHWFAIDRSILAQHGLALRGPPAREVFADLPRDMLRPVVVESLAWYVRHGSSADAALAAARAWRYASEGVWSSKPAAAEWADARVSSTSPSASS